LFKKKEIYVDIVHIFTESEYNHLQNQTWPRVSDLSDDHRRTDNLSLSLQLRESTPGTTSSFGSCFPSTGSQQCFSVPGPIYKQRFTDECLRYSIHDNPQHLAGRYSHEHFC